MHYRVNEGVIELPGNWSDKTMNVLTTDQFEEKNINLLITREEIPAEISFYDHMQRTLEGFKGNLPTLEVLNIGKGPLGGRDAHFMNIHWNNNGTEVEQLMMSVDCTPIAFTMTASAAYPISDETKNKFMEILHSLRLGE